MARRHRGRLGLGGQESHLRWLSLSRHGSFCRDWQPRHLHRQDAMGCRHSRPRRTAGKSKPAALSGRRPCLDERGNYFGLRRRWAEPHLFRHCTAAVLTDLMLRNRSSRTTPQSWAGHSVAAQRRCLRRDGSCGRNTVTPITERYRILTSDCFCPVQPPSLAQTVKTLRTTFTFERTLRPSASRTSFKRRYYRRERGQTERPPEGGLQ